MSNESDEAVSRAAALVASLEGQKIAATEKLDLLRVARSPLSLPARMGDKNAQCELERLNEAERLAEIELRDIATAMEEAQRQHETAQRQAALADRKRRKRQAERIASEFLRTDAEIDAAAKVIAQSFTKRRELTEALQHTGCVQKGWINRLGHRERANRAVLWRVRSFFEIPWIRNADMGGSLEAVDRELLGSLVAPPTSKAA